MLTPKTGNAFLILEQAQTSDGSIVLPDVLSNRKGKVGTVKMLNLWEQGRLYQLWINGRKKTVQAAIYNENYANLVGKRVYAETGRYMHYDKQDYFVVRLEHILAVLPDEGRLTADIDVNGVPRCPRCRSKSGELNMLLDGQGYCIQCGLTPDGKRRSGKLDWRGLPMDDYALNQHELDQMTALEREIKGKRGTALMALLDVVAILGAVAAVMTLGYYFAAGF